MKRVAVIIGSVEAARRAAVPFERIAEAVAGRTGAAECR